MLFICNEGNLKTKAEKRNGVTWVMGYHFAKVLPISIFYKYKWTNI